MKDKRACKDATDLHFNVEVNNQRACKDIAVLRPNVDISNKKQPTTYEDSGGFKSQNGEQPKR